MSRYWNASLEEKKRKRRRYCFFVLLFLFLSLMFVPDQGDGLPGRVRRFFHGMFSPAIDLTGTAIAGTKNWIGSWKSARELEDENGVLQLQLERLQRRVATLEEESKENERLRTILGIYDRYKPEATAARVIANGSHHDMFRTILIDKGKKNAIRKDMAAVSSGHVAVGKVLHCSQGTAQIQLLTDCLSGTGAVLEKSRQQGVVIGFSLERCRMKYVPKLQEVGIGEKVMTSGMDGIFPKGVLIGYVVKVEDGEGFYKKIEVEVAADFQKLEEVIVINDAFKEPPCPES